jgi:hypothetical protein
MSVSDALARLSGTVQRYGSEAAHQKRWEEEQARRQEEQDYRRGIQKEMMDWERPKRQLEQQEAQTELDWLNAPVTIPSMFADKDTPEGRKLSGHRLEHIMAVRDPKEGEPESQRILKTPMYEAAAKIIGAKYANEGPNRGFYVKSDGSRVTNRDLIPFMPQLEALAVARSGQGRLLRAKKEKLEEGLRTGQIDEQTYNAEMKKVLEHENNPVARIQMERARIRFLRQFPGKESQAGIERAQKSIEKQLDRLLAQKWAAGPGGRFLYEQTTGATKPLPQEFQKPDELSPSQQLRQMELENVQTITDLSLPLEQRQEAARKLQVIRGDDPRSQALRELMKNPAIFTMTQQQLTDAIENHARMISQYQAGMVEPPPPVDYSSSKKIKQDFQDGVFGDPNSEEAQRMAESLLIKLENPTEPGM